MSSLFLKILLLLILILSSSLPGEENDKNSKFLFEIGGGFSEMKVNLQASSETTRNLYFLYDVNPLLQSENQDRKKLGIYKALTYRNSDIDSKPLRIGFEYALLNFLGIGISYNSSFVKVTNVFFGDYVFLPYLLIPPPEPRKDSPEISNYFSLIKREIRDRVESADLDFRIHYRISIFDPYLRLSIGQGITDMSRFNSAVKTGFAGGIKIFPSKNFFLFAEGFKSVLRGNLGRTNFLEEVGFRFGLGISF